jgi:hypothetical protein
VQASAYFSIASRHSDSRELGNDRARLFSSSGFAPFAPASQEFGSGLFVAVNVAFLSKKVLRPIDSDLS